MSVETNPDRKPPTATYPRSRAVAFCVAMLAAGFGGYYVVGRIINHQKEREKAALAADDKRRSEERRADEDKYFKEYTAKEAAINAQVMHLYVISPATGKIVIHAPIQGRLYDSYTPGHGLNVRFEKDVKFLHWKSPAGNKHSLFLNNGMIHLGFEELDAKDAMELK